MSTFKTWTLLNSKPLIRLAMLTAKKVCTSASCSITIGIKLTFENILESDIDDEEFDGKDTEAVGQEFVNKIEVNYCSLCREYLLRTSKDEKIISDHCKSKKHLKWFYQSKKKDEIKMSAMKAKNAEEAMELASKEDDTSVQESDKISKSQTSSDKECKTATKDEETSATTVSPKDISMTDNDDENLEENSKKFKR